jgi:serine protease AprX
MRFPHWILSLAVITGLILAITFPSLASLSNDSSNLYSASITWQSKVDPWVLEQASRGDAEFLVYLQEQADLSLAEELKTKKEKGQFVYQRLTEVAERTQPNLLANLHRQGLQYRSFWVANMVLVRGSINAVQSLSQRYDVSHIYANPSVRTEIPLSTPSTSTSHGQESIEWNISLVGAPSVWAAGVTGVGAVIAGQDTGYDWDHEALINQYRGWDGGTADHDYNWHDAIHENNPNTAAGNPCGFDSPFPCDDYSHGTHTMGTMVGDNGATRQIGMAPGARWIGCRNMEQGWGTPSTYAECYQWFIAPTRIDGSDPDPDMAPDVINNSWSCPSSEGCTDPNILLSVVNNVHAAGIVTVHSAGNSGYQCSSVNTPAAIYAGSFTVGATDSTDNIASFSSRGPVTVDGSNRLKPDISAPGVGIVSSVPNNLYAQNSGTSMAAPHVAGLVALLVSARPELKGQVDTIEELIERYAVPRTTSYENCGGIPGTQVPNNTYGWGRIDAWAALQGSLMHVQKIPSDYYLAYGKTLTYTLNVTLNLGYYAALSQTNIMLTDTLPLNTSLVTATLPYTQVGNTIEWNLPDLSNTSPGQAQLVVQAPLSGTMSIVNKFYGGKSIEFNIADGGPPITTTVGYNFFFPFVAR